MRISTIRRRYIHETGTASADIDLSSKRFSVIVPTWNEQGWLPSLLRKVEGEVSVSEIIVADNSSSDDTVKIARNSNCKIVGGGLPAAGRNSGARAAKEEILLFIDADVDVTPEIFYALTLEFDSPGTTLVYFRMVPISDRLFVKLCYKVADMYARLCGLLWIHQGSAPLICVRRSAFFTVGGFDETVTAAEDVDFIRRVSRRVGGVRYVRSAPLHVSARRFDLEGNIGYALKCTIWGLLRMLGLRASIMPYRWKRYSVIDETVVEPEVPERPAVWGSDG